MVRFDSRRAVRSENWPGWNLATMSTERWASDWAIATIRDRVSQTAPLRKALRRTFPQSLPKTLAHSPHAFTNTTYAQVQNEMQGDVWLIDLARDRKVVRLIATPFHEANPAFSPDGRWLAFTSTESGRTEVYIQAFEAGDSPRLVGERRLVSRQGAVSLRWRPDGKELFYLAWDGRVYGVPITLSPAVKIGDAAPLFTIGTEARAAIHAVEAFDVSPDGQRFLVPIVTSPDKTEIVVIQNWEAAALRNRGKPN